VRHDLARAERAQVGDLVLLDAAEAVAIGDAVQDAGEPREGVGEGAVEVEDDEAVADPRRIYPACAAGG
jgi:hypothetical protein